MAKIPEGAALHSWATSAVQTHPRDMSRALSERFGVTRQAAVAALKRLAADGWLEKLGRATRPIWAPGPNRLVYFRETLPAQEHQVWIDRVGSKGKMTTDPTKHSGQGIFFSSRMCDYFTIEASELAYSHNAKVPVDVLKENESGEQGATQVFMYISNATSRTTKEVFDQYSNPDPESEGGFYKTVVPVRLARLGSENLVSRSQAKHLSAGFDKFRMVVLDFAEVNEIGQAFTDELFRVFAKMHPEIEIMSINTSEQVQTMIRHVTRPQNN